MRNAMISLVITLAACEANNHSWPGNGRDTDTGGDADTDTDTEPSRFTCSTSASDLCIDVKTPSGQEYGRMWAHVEYKSSGFQEAVDECDWLTWFQDETWDDTSGESWTLEPGYALDGIRVSATYCKGKPDFEPYFGGDQNVNGIEDSSEFECTWLAFGVDGDPAAFIGSIDTWYLGDEYAETLYTFPDGCEGGPGSDAVVDL